MKRRQHSWGHRLMHRYGCNLEVPKQIQIRVNVQQQINQLLLVMKVKELQKQEWCWKKESHSKNGIHHQCTQKHFSSSCALEQQVDHQVFLWRGQRIPCGSWHQRRRSNTRNSLTSSKKDLVINLLFQSTTTREMLLSTLVVNSVLGVRLLLPTSLLLLKVHHFHNQLELIYLLLNIYLDQDLLGDLKALAETAH
jgi:hypothetical protein